MKFLSRSNKCVERKDKCLVFVLANTRLHCVEDEKVTTRMGRVIKKPARYRNER